MEDDDEEPTAKLFWCLLDCPGWPDSSSLNPIHNQRMAKESWINRSKDSRSRFAPRLNYMRDVKATPRAVARKAMSLAKSLNSWASPCLTKSARSFTKPWNF